MTVNELTLRDWQSIGAEPSLRGMLSDGFVATIARECFLTPYEAAEAVRRVAARRYLCMTGQCDHADADRPARPARLRRR